MIPTAPKFLAFELTCWTTWKQGKAASRNTTIITIQLFNPVDRSRSGICNRTSRTELLHKPSWGHPEINCCTLLRLFAVTLLRRKMLTHFLGTFPGLTNALPSNTESNALLRSWAGLSLVWTLSSLILNSWPCSWPTKICTFRNGLSTLSERQQNPPLCTWRGDP